MITNGIRDYDGLTCLKDLGFEGATCSYLNRGSTQIRWELKSKGPNTKPEQENFDSGAFVAP